MGRNPEHRFQFIQDSAAAVYESFIGARPDEKGAAVAGDPSTQPTFMSNVVR